MIFSQQYCNTLHAGVRDFSAIWSLRWRWGWIPKYFSSLSRFLSSVQKMLLRFIHILFFHEAGIADKIVFFFQNCSYELLVFSYLFCRVKSMVWSIWKKVTLPAGALQGRTEDELLQLFLLTLKYAFGHHLRRILIMLCGHMRSNKRYWLKSQEEKTSQFWQGAMAQWTDC